MELQEQDSKAFEEIVSILQCHPEIEKFELAKEPILSLPGLEIYPSKRKVFRDRQEIQLTTKASLWKSMMNLIQAITTPAIITRAPRRARTKTYTPAIWRIEIKILKPRPIPAIRLPTLMRLSRVALNAPKK